MSSPTRNLISGLAFVAGVVLFGVVGYMVTGWSFSDAVYMVIITLFSVGYGEVIPRSVK